MSIIHEALKKASRDEPPGPAIERPRRNRFIDFPFFPSKTILVRLGLLACFTGVVYIAYVERGVFTSLFTSRRVQTAPGLSGSDVLPASSDISGGGEVFSEEPSRPEPVDTKNTASAHAKSGVSYLEQEMFTEAEREFLLAVSLDPESTEIQNNLGLVLMKQGRAGEAESRYHSALRLDPENVQTLNNLGLLFERQNRLEEAKRLYQKAIMTRPNFPDPHLNYAVLLERAGFFEESKRHYQSFLVLAGHEHGPAVQLVKRHLDRLP